MTFRRRSSGNLTKGLGLKMVVWMVAAAGALVMAGVTEGQEEGVEGQGAASAAAAAARIDKAILHLELTRWQIREADKSPQQREPWELPPRTTDDVFIRRVSLDLHARLPEPDAVRAFLADTDSEKRSRLVDRLLGEPEAGARRFMQFAEMLRVKDSVRGYSMRPYVAWLRKAAEESLPYDKMVQALLTTTGDLEAAPASGFLLTDAGQMPRTMQEILRVFLDENTHCATCHDHPFARVSQMDYYRMAGTLTGVEVVRTLPGPGALPLRLWPGEPADGEREDAGAGEEPGAEADAGDEEEAAESVGTQPLEPRMLWEGETLQVRVAQQIIPVFLPKGYYYTNGKPGQSLRPGLPAWTAEGMGELQPVQVGVPMQGQAQAPVADAGGGKDVVKVEEEAPAGANAALTAWLLGSPRFAEVAALRTWRELFGSPVQGARDMIESADGSRSPDEMLENRSCESPLRRTANRDFSEFEVFLDRGALPAARDFARLLAEELVRVKFDLREFERVLCLTQAYQRRSQEVALGHPAPVWAPVVRRLPAETIWNNLVRVETGGGQTARGRMSADLPQVPGPEHPSRLWGRGERWWGDDSLRMVNHAQTAFMMVGSLTRQASDPGAPLVRKLATVGTADHAVEELFLTVLGRMPSPREKAAALGYVTHQPQAAWGDLVWALLNTSEFVFQY